MENASEFPCLKSSTKLQIVTRRVRNLSPSRAVSPLSTAVSRANWDYLCLGAGIGTQRVTVQHGHAARDTHLVDSPLVERSEVSPACAADSPASSAWARAWAFRPALPDTAPAFGQSLR